ncbi:uncharacterized protein LOC141592250 isoform X1 [Silene latifolia]|uniref:uncharacterized protein LOC141592250 isoform X1 n=1 Tax=Silene latifolia TaxID=37657 RepID=UPI003D776E98
MGSSKKAVKYILVDAFADTEFNSKAAALSLVEEKKDEPWLHSLAPEFNVSQTCFLTRFSDSNSIHPRFRLRWFTPLGEVELCENATLAAAQFCFSSKLVTGNIIEFSTLIGILTAKKILDPKEYGLVKSEYGDVEQQFLIELDFPAISTTNCPVNETSLTSNVLSNRSTFIGSKKTASEIYSDVLPSADAIAAYQLNLEETKQFPGRGLIISAGDPSESGFHSLSRFFCPKFGNLMPSKSPIKYYVVNAFSESPFRGNPAAVCVLQEEKEEKWLQYVAREFNLSATCFLTKVDDSNALVPKYRLRWFAPAVELNICGHGTIAAAYVLFQMGMVKHNKVEFHIKSGKLLLAERIVDNIITRNEVERTQHVSVRLVFPLIPIIGCDSTEMELASTFTTCTDLPINVVKMSYEEELIVEYPSGKVVADLCPSINEIQKWQGRGVVITGAAPKDSGFDFFSRFFCPNLGMIEDPVCGSIHCGVAPYWSKKLGRKHLKAYMASPRGGELELQVDEEKQQVLIQGKAVVVMEGFLFP